MKTYEKIKLLREERNLTQEQLASALAISTNSVKNYEDEQKGRIPEPTTLIAMSKYFNVSTDYLLHDDLTIRHYNDIKVAEELGLTNESIAILRNISHTHSIDINAESINLCHTFDAFIKTVDLSDFLVMVELLQWLSELYYSTVRPLAKLASEQDDIITYVKDNNTTELDHLFTRYENLLKHLESYVTNFYQITAFYTSDKIPYKELKKYFELLKIKLLSDGIAKYENTEYIEFLSEYQNCIHIIENTILSDIEIVKFRVNKIIMLFTEKVEKQEFEKWEDIQNVSTRNHKK